MHPFFMLMLMVFTILTMNMSMRMCVDIFVGVLQFNRIFNHEISTDDHHHQSDIKSDSRSFAPNQHSEGHSQERCDGIISTGLGYTQILLRMM